MKKIFALMLSLALLACGAAAAGSAEKEEIGVVGVNDIFTVRGRLPEDYRISYKSTNPLAIVASVVSENPEKPYIELSIVFNDSYTQDGKAMKLNDVSEEDMALIRESFEENMDQTEFREVETAQGTKTLVVRGNMGGQNRVDVYTIYESYEIEALVTAGEGAQDAQLTEEQVRMIVDFFSELEFIPAQE